MKKESEREEKTVGLPEPHVGIFWLVNGRVSPKVEEEFGFAEMPLVSFADLYAGKIMAALDRQHPRDLFDIRDLLAR